jgi:transposase-like protein
MLNETARRYLLVAIDRAARQVVVAIKPNKTAAAARQFLKLVARTFPFKIHHVLTDNGKAFSDRLFATRAPANGKSRVRPALPGAWHRALRVPLPPLARTVRLRRKNTVQRGQTVVRDEA